VLTGADLRLMEALQLGAHGSIGGISNAFPDILVKIYQLAQKKEFEESKKWSQKLNMYASHLKDLPFPLNISAMMEARDLTTGIHKAILSLSTIKKYNHLVSQLKTLIS
jgi:dihydrodipicolinate synthase/N-acetylneuraminate lyase